MRNLLIGAADTYSTDVLVPWAKSFREVNPNDDIWLIVYRRGPQWNEQVLKDLKINVYEVSHDPFGQPIQHEHQDTRSHSHTKSHNLRFYHAWEMLTRLEAFRNLKNVENAQNNIDEVIEPYTFAVMTDVKDVIFQQDPMQWLEGNMKYGTFEIVAGSEGINFEREPWNQNNLIQGYGPIFWDLEGKKWQAFNVGTLGGYADTLKDTFHILYRMTEGRYYPSDQSPFNVLMNSSWMRTVVFRGFLKTGWAAQMGICYDDDKPQLRERALEVPHIKDDGTVWTRNDQDGKLVCLVHQWDRTRLLRDKIRSKYV